VHLEVGLDESDKIDDEFESVSNLIGSNQDVDGFNELVRVWWLRKPSFRWRLRLARMSSLARSLIDSTSSSRRAIISATLEALSALARRFWNPRIAMTGLEDSR
jgi:hypothetical protein